jgi:REP element-mobilizing transposase RayT
MTLFKNKYRAETTRLKGWDYARDGYYFITVCIKNRVCLLGDVVDGTMKLNEYGKIVKDCWFDLPNHYSNIKLDAFCIMPNHIHGIIIINNGNVDTGFKPVSTPVPKPSGIVDTGFKPVSTTTPHTAPHTTPPPKKRHGLFEFVRALKTFSARRINELRKSVGDEVWQSRFHDRIVRNNNALQRIRYYIENNPKAWQHDKHYNRLGNDS